MAHNSDWMPGTRDGILNLGEVWMTVFARNSRDWGIPAEEITGLTDMVSARSAKKPWLFGLEFAVPRKLHT